MALRILTLILIVIFLPACSGDGIKDKNPDDRMVRETMCVIASERFQLYNEAKKHLSHGIEAGRVRFHMTDKLSDFRQKIHKARSMMNGMSKEYNAKFLKTRCDKEITVAEFENA